jgi:hypothetical protein
VEQETVLVGIAELTPDEKQKFIGVLLNHMPWLAIDGDTGVSGSDAMDQMGELYENLGGVTSPEADDDEEDDSDE